MTYKIDIYHNNKALTFGPRFKGEVGKDIFAVKVALGLLTPISEAEEGQVSYDQRIPLDEQKWFDCSSGLGVDITTATRFDTTLENALISYQINNQFLITSYYFEKFGFLNLLNSAITNETVPEAEVLSQLDAANGFFESELRTLGEATIAIMHGWRPATTLTKNTSYTHDGDTYSRSNVVYDVVSGFLYDSLLDSTYPQNFQKLVEDGIAVENGLRNETDYQQGETFQEFVDSNFSSRRSWASRIDADMVNFRFGTIEYYPVFEANSPLYVATTKVIDYYLENDLFSQARSQEELREAARRAIYPDPFSRTDPFIIDGTKMGIYTETDFFLRAEGPLPNDNPETIALLEELALIQALKLTGKPQIWNFFKEDLNFKTNYFSGIDQNLDPSHSGVYPRNITRGMLETLQQSGEDFPSPESAEFRDFKMDNYWVLSTSDITNELEEGDNSIEYWRVIEGLGGTEPLIKFVEFITPSLRPGQSYRALFEINRQKFESIVNGDNLEQEQPEQEGLDTEPTEEEACLDQSSEQKLRTYEEYRSHAIKKRRDLVRQIRDAVQTKNRKRIDLGALDSVFEGVNIDTYSDYEMVQRIAQLLPGQELAELIGQGASDALDWISNNVGDSKSKEKSNPDNDSNLLSITFGELKERLETAAEDLKESAEVIKRERIRFEQGSDFNGQNEASNLSTLAGEIASAWSEAGAGIVDETTLTFKFEDALFNKREKPGHRNGKRITSISGDHTKLVSLSPNKFSKYEAINRARTINYLSQIKDMTFFPKLVSFFDDSRNSCKDLGINVDKMTAYAYVTKHTSGLKIIADESEDFSFKSWWEERVEDPIKEFGQTSADNARASVDPDNFDEDAALRALGKECKKEKIWEEIFDRLDPVSLLCDYIKCLKLPAFDIKFPDFNLDPFPKIPIIGWYRGLINFIQDNLEEIIERLGCTIGRMIIDKLAFPFCEEQLQDFISNGIESTQPFARQAIIESLTRTGVPGEKSEEAKNFFDSVANILTGRELCYILAGNRPDNATMSAIMRMAEINGVSEDLTTEEDAVNFFGVIGSYFPDEVCEQLSNSSVLRPTSCEDTNDVLRAIRNRLQSEDSTLTEQEVNNAIEMARKNKQEEADRLQALLENGFSGMVPKIFDYGNPDSPLSDFPEFFKKEQEKTATSLFSKSKAAYVSGLSSYVPSMYVPSPVTLWPYDERYDQTEVLRLEAALEQIRTYSTLVQDSSDLEGQGSLENQYKALTQLFQVEVVSTISGELIPEEIKRNLVQDSVVGGGTYKIPHEFEITQPGPNNTQYVRRGQGVLVHKRMIVQEGALTAQQIESEMNSLLTIINKYSDRISDTWSGGKRRRLRAERRPFIERYDALNEILISGNFSSAQEVSYEFFLAYQKNINDTDFQELGLEFALVPFDPPVYSETVEFASFEDPNFLIIQDRPTMFNENNINGLMRERFGTATDTPESFAASLKEIEQRITDLNDRIKEILERRPPITDEALFPGLQKMLDQQTEKSLEKLNSESVRAGVAEFEIKFNAGAIYSPSITLKEFVSDEDKDRFDIIVQGDYYTGLGLEGRKEFKYCNQLPDKFTTPELPILAQANGSFAKRFRFRNAVVNSLGKVGYSFNLRSRFGNFLTGELYKSTTEALIESLLDELGDSYLFEAADTELLDKRVSGKRQINENCVSNRYSLGDGSVVSFGKVILGNVSEEIAKEMSKPENSPENYDFDTVPAFDLAMQNLALKGFVRACLIDLLLKGGIAYSIWDIEPIVGEKFFVDYAISLVRHELESSDNAREIWGTVIERVTGISNRFIALETLVKEEILKLPNYSKQVFNPQDNKTNFYNWFSEKYITQYHVSSREEITDNGLPKIARNTIENQTRLPFLREKQQFIIEHYIEITGRSLVEIMESLLETQQTRSDSLILSIKDFIEIIPRATEDVLQQVQGILEQRRGFIKQASRVVLVDPVPYFAEDVRAVAFDPNESISNSQELDALNSELAAKQQELADKELEILNKTQEVFDARRDNAPWLPLVQQQLRDLQEELSEIESEIIRIEAEIVSAEEFQEVTSEEPEPVTEEVQRNRFVREILRNQDDPVGLGQKSVTMKSYWVGIRYSSEDAQDANSESNAFAIPLFSKERELDFIECYSLTNYTERDFLDAIPFMKQEISSTEEYKMVFDHIFPTRRLMSMSTVFATSVVSGYNSMPSVLSPVKKELAASMRRMGMTRNQRAEMKLISQEELAKQLTENFPVSDDACIDWPDGLGDFFEKFLEDLWKLMKQMPSIILRGIANQLDPAYKEMRQHYINCDIDNLTYLGLRPAGTVDYKLTNGLYLSGRSRDQFTGEDLSELQGKNKGKYVPLVLGLASDLGYTASSLGKLDFERFGRRLGYTIGKLITYIYSGNAPFLDPSFYFKVPCADIDVGAWRDGGKYDAGSFGRYGHPLSPFTYLALATPQLESDKRTKENNCIDTPEVECEVLDPNEIVYRSETEAALQEDTPASTESCIQWSPALIEELAEIERSFIEEARSRNGIKQAFDQSSRGQFRIDLPEEEFRASVSLVLTGDEDQLRKNFLISMYDAYNTHTERMALIYQSYETMYSSSCDPKPEVSEVSTPELILNREYGLPGGPVVD